MLENILQRLLGRYLEPYVYNLSRENLRLGVLSGNLVLENLKLKENLGDILNLPLTIDSGQIDHVSITIPWTSLGYKPLVTKLKGIHVVARPKDYGDLDEETLRKKLRESKEKLIEYRERRLNERFLNGELTNSNDNSINLNTNGSSEKGNESSNNSSNNNKIDENNSANGTNLLWRIIKKIVANVQIEIQDIHICMAGFQSNIETKSAIKKSSDSDIILGIMIKSGFVVTTDSSGNKNFDISNSETKPEDPNALFKTLEINDVCVYVGQYFPNSLNYKKNCSKKDESTVEFNLVNVNNVRDILYDGNNINKKASDILESKYLFVYDKVDTKISLGAWRLEFVLKPLTFKLNISHSEVNNELKGVLQVFSITEHTVIVRRSHLRPIIFSLQSLNLRQEKYREILLKDSHLVMLDPVSMRTTTQDEYISLYSRKLKLEAIKLYNSEGNENNFFGVIINPLSKEEITRLQILDDVICIRNIAKWRCKAREIINRIIIEASSRKKLRNLSADTKSLQMEKGNLIVNNTGLANSGINIDGSNNSNNISWTKWAINKITGRNDSVNHSNIRSNNGFDASSPSYLMQHRGIISNNDFTVSSNNALITEEEMDVIITAVTNEKYFEKIETPTKFSITFGLAYFGITVFDDVSKPIIHETKNYNVKEINMNDTSIYRNLATRFIDSIPNPKIDSTFLTLKLHELYIQFNIHSVIDRNDKDSNEWNFSTYIRNLSLNHYNKKILFFDSKNGDKAECNVYNSVLADNEVNNSKSTLNKDLDKNSSIYNLGSLIRSFSDSFGFDNSKNIKKNNKSSIGSDYYLNNSSIFLHVSHNVNNDGNSLKLILKVSPIEAFITPQFILDMNSLLYLYNSIILISNNVSQECESMINKNNICNKMNYGKVNNHGNYLMDNNNEFVVNLIEKGNSVKYLSQNNSFPDFIYFDIEILSPVIHILCNDYWGKENSLLSIQFILGNCYVKTKSICELDKLDINIELSNTQVKYLTYVNENDESDISSSKLNINNNNSIIEGLRSIKEFIILHPIPVLININIHNQKKEEIGSQKDNLYVHLTCNLQQFILTINNDTLKYILHIPLSFYNVLSFPNILGYYYLPRDTLNFVDTTESTCEHLNKKKKIESNDILHNQVNNSDEYLESGNKIANDVLLLMNKTLKIECYTKSDILSFKMLSDSGSVDFLQGSIKSITSCFFYDSVKSAYKGKINLNRALITSSYTKKPLLLVVTDFDPLTDNLSDNYNNNCFYGKKSQIAEMYDFEKNKIDGSYGLVSKDNDSYENSFENDNLFVDAIEEYDSTLEICFEYESKQNINQDDDSHNNDECVLNISLISSPIELYWDKPTILNLIECVKSYQKNVYDISILHMETLSKIYLLNKFYNMKIEYNLIENSEITSIYGNTYKISDINDFINIQSLIIMKNYMFNIECMKNDNIDCLKIGKEYDRIWMNDLRRIIFHLKNSKNYNWIYGLILMPPRFNYLHVQNVFKFLKNINKFIDYNNNSHSINSDKSNLGTEYNNFDSNFNIYSDIYSVQHEIDSANTTKEKLYSDEILNNSNKMINDNILCGNDKSDFNIYNIKDHYQKYMISGLYDDTINEDDIMFDNDHAGLPEFSFLIGDRINKKPRVKFTYILKGGSLTFIKEEKVYVTIGISNICICFDVYDTGDKKIKFFVNNCSFIINDKCVLSRYSKSEKPLLLIYMNIYKSLNDSGNILFGNELNIALKCYMDSLCYIIYYKDMLEFVDYINDGVLDTLISKSYKAAKSITSKKILLYYISISNSVIKLPEDHDIKDYSNAKDIFDETVQHYKDTLHDLLQEIYFDSIDTLSNSQSYIKSDDIFEIKESFNNKVKLERIPSDDLIISSYLLERINNKESLILLEKSISDYPRFRHILYDVNLFEKTQSYCKINTKNIKIYNKMINNKSLIRNFYDLDSNENFNDFELENNIWIIKTIITDGIVDIIECKENNGSDQVNGRIIENINSEIEFGISKYFPNLIITRLSNNKKFELNNDNISLLNINLSPLAMYLSRQQLTFIINVITENFSNTTKINNDSKISNNSLININISQLSLETSFSHLDFDPTNGYKSTSMPLSLLTLFECKIHSNIFRIEDNESDEFEKYIKFSITSKKYYFDDLRLITNSKYRRILNGGFKFDKTVYNEELLINNYNDDAMVKEINNIISKDKCSIQFIFESSNIYGNQIFLKAFNPKVYIGFNCIIDFYYYLSHGFRSSFSKLDNNSIINKENDTSTSLLFRENKESIMKEFEELIKIINKLDKLKFEFRLEINSGFFGFVTDPQKIINIENNKMKNSEELMLILETNINCSITNYMDDTIIRHFDLLDCILYFTEIIDNENKTIENKQGIKKFNSRLLKPILYCNSKYKHINFNTPNIINEDNKLLIANSFDIRTYGKYCNNIREIPDIYITSISLGELIFVLNIKNLEINITPYLLSVLINISKKLFSDGPSISPLYTSTLKNKCENENRMNTNRIENNICEELQVDNLNHNDTKSNIVEGPPPIRRLYIIKITIEKINLKIIKELHELKLKNKKADYVSYLPIINFEISLPEWRIDIFPLKTNHTLLDASLKLNILDINNQIWEPIIEKCIFSIYCFYDHLILYDPYVIPVKKSLRKYFHSTFSKSLLINIKPSVISAIILFIDYYSYLVNNNNDIDINNGIDNNKTREENDDKITKKEENFDSHKYKKPLLLENDVCILDMNKLSELKDNLEIYDKPYNIVNNLSEGMYEKKNGLKYINLTGYPYYCFTLTEENNYSKKLISEYYLNQLLLLLPNDKIRDLNFSKNKYFTNDKISLKNINNSNSKIPLLRVSLSSKMFCLFSAPIDKDILKLKKEFQNIDIEYIIRVMAVYKSYDLSKKLLNYYKDLLNNHNDICSNIIGPLPNGLNFTNYNENISSSANIDTIIPYHNLYYIKNLISNKSDIYKRLFLLNEYKTDDIEKTKNYTRNSSLKLSLSKSLGMSISRSLSKSSTKSIKNVIQKSSEKRHHNYETDDNIECKNVMGNNTGYNHNNNSYKNVLGQIISIDSMNKLFCIISNNRIINKSGIPIEVCFLSDDNIPIQLFDVSKISVEKDVCDLILNHEVPNNQYKYNYNNNKCENTNIDNSDNELEYINDKNMNYNELKTIPTWLNNNDIINTILDVINKNIYNSEEDVSGIINYNNIINKSGQNNIELEKMKLISKSKKMYYTYFLPNNHMMSVPQIALLNNNCNVIFRPSIIGLFEIYNIYNQYNNDNDIEQMLLDNDIYIMYMNLMGKYNSEENVVLNDKYFYDKLYELLKLFKTSNGEFILDLYYTFWNNMIIKFKNNNDKMDLYYLYSRGWTQNIINTSNKNINKTNIHTSNIYSNYKYLVKKNGNSVSNNNNNNNMFISKENSLYFQSYIQGYQSLFPGNINIKNIFIYPGFSIFNLIPTLLEIKLKSSNCNFLPKTPILHLKLKPFNYYNLYQFSNESKLQMKTRISLDNINSVDINFFDLNNNNEFIDDIDNSLYTKWSSSIDLNMSETESSFTLHNNFDSCNIDIQYIFIDKLNNNKCIDSITGLMQKNVLAFNLCTWFINRTKHNIIPIYDDMLYPYINIGINNLYIKNNIYNNQQQKIYLLNNRNNYLKIYFSSIEKIKKKYKNEIINDDIDKKIYNEEEKIVFKAINNSNNKGSNSQELINNSNIGLLEIPSLNNTYSFPILDEDKVYYFTVKNKSLFYNNLDNNLFNSRIITISPHIVLYNLTKGDNFYWYSITFPNINQCNNNSNIIIGNDVISKIDPNDFISIETDNNIYRYNLCDLNIIKYNEYNNIVSNKINIDKFISNNIEYNNNDNENNSVKNQNILVYFSKISLFDDKEKYTGINNFNNNCDYYCYNHKIRWSQPILLSSESNGIYYISIPSDQDKNNSILLNPKTYCMEIINSNGLFIIKIKECDSTDNLWDGIIFTNYCDYLSRINIETYHYEYDIETKRRHVTSNIENSSNSKKSLLNCDNNLPLNINNGINGCRNNDLVIRYVINNNNTNSPVKIAWSSPFIYSSKNCRLYIIPKVSKIINKDLDLDLDTDITIDDNISSLYGIMAFDLNFNYNNHNNPYQSKRYILSLPESDIIKLCDMYPYLNSNYFLNSTINNLGNSYPIAIISVITRKNGLYIDILPPRNHSSLLINLMKKNSLLLNNIQNKITIDTENYYLEDICQKRINEMNKLNNNDLWQLIYTYYRKITIDISQIGISVISETRESEIMYIELSTIQFKKQEKNKNGLIDTYRFIIGDIQIDNQFIKSCSKCYISSSNSKYYTGIVGNENLLMSNLNNNVSTNSSGIIPYVLLGNKINEYNNSSNNNDDNNNNNLKSLIVPTIDPNNNLTSFLVIKWSCLNSKSQWDTNIYNFECDLSSDLELNFDFNIYKIISEFIYDCKNYYYNLIKSININKISNNINENNGIYVLNMTNILSKKQKIYKNIKPKTTFSIEKIKISSMNLYVWCSIPLSELNYLPEWFRIGLKILTVSNALELRGAPIKLESHNIDNLIGTFNSIFNVFYEYYMAELLWRIGTVLGHSSFVNIPLVPLQIGKNTLNMAFSTISIVNSNIINLLSNLTLDSEYVNSRQREITYKNISNVGSNTINGISNNYYTNLVGGGFLNSNSVIQDFDGIISTVRTNNIGENTSSFKKGFAQAGYNLTQGLLSLGNVITKPIEGAQKNGFTGFCSGLIKGVTSSVVKPIDHIGQALNNVIDGIQAEVNKPLGGYKQKVMRRRIPRMLYSYSNNIKDYNINDALLKEIIGSNLTKHLVQYFLIPTNNFDMPLVLLLYPKKIALIKIITSLSMDEYYSSCINNGYSSLNVTGTNLNNVSNNSDNNIDNNTDSRVGISYDYHHSTSITSYGNNSNNNYKSKLLWIVNIEDINEIKASSHGLIIELSLHNRGKYNIINDSLQIPICKFSLINEINVALDNSQNNASPHLVFRKD